jgi:hypothetical protein
MVWIISQNNLGLKCSNLKTFRKKLTPKLTNNITIAVKVSQVSALPASALPVSAYQTSKSLSKFYPEQF